MAGYAKAFLPAEPFSLRHTELSVYISPGVEVEPNAPFVVDLTAAQRVSACLIWAYLFRHVGHTVGFLCTQYLRIDTLKLLEHLCLEVNSQKRLIHADLFWQDIPPGSWDKSFA